jgi:hypothetical protein
MTTVLVWFVVRTVPVLAVLPTAGAFSYARAGGSHVLDYDDLLYLISEN